MSTIIHPAFTCPQVWLEGKLVGNEPPGALRFDPFAQSLDYSALVISGLRVTPHHRDQEKRLIFCLRDHMERLLDSSQRRGLEINWSVEDLGQAAIEVVAVNGCYLTEGGYLRAIAFDDRPIIAPQFGAPAKVAIFAAPFGEYLPETGAFICTLDGQLRVGNLGQMKGASNYTAFAIAKHHGRILGADDVVGVTVGRLGELILTEGTTSNLFVVRDGVVVTPPLDAGVLAGITRRRVLEFTRHLGYPTEERDVPLAEMPFAQEIWVTGTASYVRPFSHFGRHPLQTRIGDELNLFLRRVMRGEVAEFAHFNTEVLTRAAEPV